MAFADLPNLPDLPDIAVISLTSAARRRHRIQQQLWSMNLPFRFFDALTTRQGPQHWFTDYDRTAYRMHARREATAGEIGCYASHLALWQQCVATGRPIAVLEDDALLAPEFPAALRAAFRLVQPCGFIRLEANKQPAHPLLPARDQSIAQVDGFDLRYLNRVARCTTAYIISPETAHCLIAHSDTLKAPVDRFIQLTWLHRQALFMLAPPVAEQEGFSSGLDNQRRGNGQRQHNPPTMRLQRGLFKAGTSLQRWYFNRTVGADACLRVQKAISPQQQGDRVYSLDASASPASSGNA